MNLWMIFSMMIAMPLAVIFSMLTALVVTRRIRTRLEIWKLVLGGFVSYMVWAVFFTAMIYLIGTWFGA